MLKEYVYNFALGLVEILDLLRLALKTQTLFFCI